LIILTAIWLAFLCAATSRREPTEPSSDVLRLEDVDTVAARLSVTSKEVRRLIARGELFSVKLGRLRLVPSVEVDRYIAALVDAARNGQAD
jgi:excisionase family DNA binding protein